jgi:lysozyme
MKNLLILSTLILAILITACRGNIETDTLNKAAAMIQKFEGCRLAAYPDPKTHNLPITIGYGATRKLGGGTFKLGDKITKSEARELLIIQLRRDYIPAISKVPHWNKMSVNQRAVLISFGYNLGKNFYGSKKFTTLSAALRNKAWSKVPAVLKLYSNPRSSVHEGLLARRIKEGGIWAGKINLEKSLARN